MTATYTYDGGALTRVRAGSVSLTQVAEHGRVGTGSFTYDDTPGTQDIVGQKDFSATEDACANPGTFAGFVTVRGYSRKSERQAAAREIDVSLDDLNAMLGFRIFYTHSSDGETTEDGGKRNAETIAARGAWLLAQEAVTGLFVDNGRCDFSSSITMDAADYRLQRPGDVLADMALAAGAYNHYIRDFGDGPELVFRNDNTSTDDTSTISISNVIADVEADALTFYPFKDAVLTRNPAGVVSKIAYSYSVKTVLQERAATASTFNGERDGTISNSNVHEEATARAQAVQQLNQLSTEDDSIECMIQVPPEAANLINHGDRVQARFSHLAPEGYGEMTWFRVIECTKAPLLKPAALYNISLKLSPQENQVCGGVVQSTAVVHSTSGPSNVSFTNPVTPGNIIVAIGARADTSSVPLIEHLGADAGFTALGEPVEQTGNDGGQARAWAQGKVATDATLGPWEFNDGGSYLWKMYEIAGDFASRTVITADDQVITPIQTSALSTGTLSGAGTALMVQVVGKPSAHGACINYSGVVDLITMGSDWTEDYDGRMDPTDPGSIPYAGFGHASPTSSVACSWTWTCPTYTGPGGQGLLGTWAGIAVLFEC